VTALRCRDFILVAEGHLLMSVHACAGFCPVTCVAALVLGTAMQRLARDCLFALCLTVGVGTAAVVQRGKDE
jgi:hypothetical protein